MVLLILENPLPAISVRHQVCCAVAIAMFFGTACALQAQETVTVRPEDNGAALVNPGMGWTMHFYSNNPKNYGSKLSPADTLDDFPGHPRARALRRIQEKGRVER